MIGDTPKKKNNQNNKNKTTVLKGNETPEMVCARKGKGGKGPAKKKKTTTISRKKGCKWTEFLRKIAETLS